MNFRKAAGFALTYSPSQIVNRLKAEVYLRNSVVHYLPTNLSIDLTTACNLNCPWCSTKRYRSENSARHLSLAGGKKLLDKFKLATFVAFCGAGETFLNQDLFAMARYAYKLKMKVLIATNGTLLSSRMDEVLHSNIDILEISLKSTCEAEFRQVFGTKKTSLTSITSGIKFLARHPKRPWLRLSYVCQRDSVSNIPRVLEIANQCGVDEVCLYNMIPSPELRNESKCFFENDREWVLKILDSCVIESNKIVVRRPGFYPRNSLSRKCNSPFISLRIGPDGGVSGCPRAIIPSLKNGNAFLDDDVFNSEHFQKLRAESLDNKLNLRYECLYCENRC
jgi:MoaA/NifB/PqqE/SkfB family radical SAM enzyme